MTPARVKLTFPEQLVRQPIIGRMVQEFGVLPNIRRASVEEHVGWMICEIDGDGSHVDAAVAWLVGLGVQVDRLNDVVES
ncbi:MAG TPA: NIL domain-containing protein [Acidimicrobiales bacterium]